MSAETEFHIGVDAWLFAIVAARRKMTLLGAGNCRGREGQSVELEPGKGSSCVGLTEQIRSLQIAVNRNVAVGDASRDLRGIDISASTA